jgi:recombination protein RecT
VDALISQRSAQTQFVPNMYVFPGGRVDADDAHWVGVWAGLFPAHWRHRTRCQALAAVRECFEEMGVALALDAAGGVLGADAQAQLQRQQPFFAQLAALGWQPDLGHLAWVSERVPPASLERRYHTAFFYAAMPAGQVLQPDMQEQLDAVWLPVRDPAWQGQEGAEGKPRYPMIAPTQEALIALQGFAGVAAALASAHADKQSPAPHYFAREVRQQGAVQRIKATHLAYAEAELIDPTGRVQPSVDWQYQTPVALTRSVLRLTCPNPSMMSGPGTNTYFIGSAEQGFVVLDAGPADKGHLRRILQATQGRIHRLFCTHSHPDHSPGAVLLHRFLRRKGRAVPLLGMASAPSAVAHSRFTPTVAVEHGQTLELPAIADKQALTLQCIHTPGHAANHVCLLLQEDGILFSGDHILSGTTTVIAPPDGDMQAYLDALDTLDAACERWDAQYILPAHGFVLGGFGQTDPTQNPPIGEGAGARRIIAYYRQHRLAREAKVIAAMQQLGVHENTAQSRQQLLPLAYADAPPALWPVAERSLDAHIRRILDLNLLAKA